jgi:dTDP-glucose pyrophosphorylase
MPGSTPARTNRCSKPASSSDHRKPAGLKVACPEEISWRNGWIDDAQLEKCAQRLGKSGYGQYLLGLLRDKVFA